MTDSKYLYLSDRQQARIEALQAVKPLLAGSTIFAAPGAEPEALMDLADYVLGEEFGEPKMRVLTIFDEATAIFDLPSFLRKPEKGKPQAKVTEIPLSSLFPTGSRVIVDHEVHAEFGRAGTVLASPSPLMRAVSFDVDEGEEPHQRNLNVRCLKAYEDGVAEGPNPEYDDRGALAPPDPESKVGPRPIKDSPQA